MIDHVILPVNDLNNSKSFYEKALSPLNYSISFGEEGEFWAFDIGIDALFEIAQYDESGQLTPFHIAFRAKIENK